MSKKFYGLFFLIFLLENISVKKLVCIFILFIFFADAKSHAQTFDRNSVFKCAQVFGDSITFLNDFIVNRQKRKTKQDPNGQEWEVYLMQGTEYRFALCCYKGESIVLKLYDDTVTEAKPYYLINQRSKKFYFDYVCKKSAVYKVSIRFKNDAVLNKELSAIGILGFIKKIKL